MPDFQISCILLVSGTESANAVPKVISPLLYVPYNGSALLEKSVKIEICQQSKLSLCQINCIHIQWNFNVKN